MTEVRSIDRRWIFLSIGLLVVVLYAADIKAPLPTSRYVQSFYATIEALPEGSIVLLSADFDAGSAAEMKPMYDAAVHHLLRRNLRVVNVATWPAAPPFTREAFGTIAPQYGKVYGRDWVELGFRVGDDVALGQIGQSLRTAYPTDKLNGAPYDSFPILRDVGDSSRGIALLITISAGFPGVLEWIPQLGSRYGVPIIAGTTAVQTPQLFAYYPNQIKGFLGAATGATQYLQLVGEQTPELHAQRDSNQRRMLVQSWAHVLIIGLIVIGNVLYFAGRRRSAA
ncbi:MAG: hypothetical protein ACT4PU_10480 [Planctomycetota bacterium]